VLGVYGGTPLTHAEAISQGTEAAHHLELTESDRVCCSVTLMHPFGIGSSVTSTLLAGGTLVLPAVGGIRGCGDPKQRAQVTLETLASTKTTVVFGDSHTLKAMLDAPPPSQPLSLRTGAIKIGSGASFLAGIREIPASKGGQATPLEYGGVALRAVGKAL